MRNETASKTRLVFYVVTLAIAMYGGYELGEPVRLAEKPAEYVAVIFSILAAALFAVVAIVGDPGMLAPGSTASAWVNAREIQKELHKLNFLFFIYLTTLGLLVASEIAESSGADSWYWLTNVFAGFAIWGFLLSFGLPIDFMSLQKRRLEQEISSRSKRL